MRFTPNKKLRHKKRKKGTSWHKKYIKDWSKKISHKVLSRRRINKFRTGHQTSF